MHHYFYSKICFGLHHNQTDIFSTACILYFDNFHSRLSFLAHIHREINKISLKKIIARTRLGTRQEKVCWNRRRVEKHLTFFEKTPSLQLARGCQKKSCDI